MREPGDEDDEAVVAGEIKPMTPPAWVAQCQRLIDHITATSDTNLKQLYHRQLTELLMKKRP